jgi:hypothetical protein
LDSNFLIPNKFVDNKTELGIYYQVNYDNVLVDGLSLWGMLRVNYNKNYLDYDVRSSLTQFYDITFRGMNIFDTNQASYFANDISSKDYFIFSPKFLLTYYFDNKGKIFGSFKYGAKNGGYNIQMLSDVAQGNLRAIMIDELKKSIYDKLTSQGMPGDVVNNVILSRFPNYPYYSGNIGDIL